MYGDELELYFSMTEKCNWNCFYCDFPTINKPSQVDINYLKEIVPKIKKITDKFKIQMCIEGGELGLVDEEILDYMFIESGLVDNQVKWHIATNGLFLKKGYHKKYKENIRSILYHVKPDIDQNTNFNFNSFEEYNFDIFYTIVVHKKNIPLLKNFFNFHKGKLFVPHVLQPRIKGLDLLDLNYYTEIYNIIKDCSNVHPHFITRYKYIIENFDNQHLMNLKRKFCCENYKKMMIDFPNNKIIRCCISMGTDKIEFNETNLNNTLKNNIGIFPKWDVTCKNCIAGFVFRKPSVNVLKEMISKTK